MSAARLRFVLRLLWASIFKRRSRLMLVGAALALAATLAVVLTSISAGVGAKLGEGLRMFGANVTIAPAARATGSGALGTGDLVQALDPVPVESALRQIPGVESFHARVELPVRVATLDTHLIGIAPDELAVARFRLVGRLPGTGEALLGRDVASRLGIGAGGTVNVAGVDRVVSGVVETGAEEDDAVVVPLEDAMQLTGGGVTRFLVRVSPEGFDATVKALTDTFDGLEVRTLEQVASAEGTLLDRVSVLLLTVTIGVAFSAAIAVGTTLNLVVLERGGEIGLMKALGGTSSFVVGYFVLEQAGTALAAGILGVIAGMAAAEAVSLSVFGTALPFAVSALAAGLGSALAIALVAGVLPALRISRVSAADALRGL